MKTLNVWWDSKIVGLLTQDDHGNMGFVYSAEWLEDDFAKPLSGSLPKRAKAFSRQECWPFFSGLLPDENQRIAVAQSLGVSKSNVFGLLERLGGDVAGALQLLPMNETPSLLNDKNHEPTKLDDKGLAEVLEALPRRPLLAGEGGLRLSLAGAQTKVPVVLVEDVIALPAPGQPTTHIIKPPISRFNATTENEAFVMRLAAAVGLDVATVEPRIVGGHPFLLIARYDREWLADGSVKRLHQEDFCQALGIAPEKKYPIEGGPAFAQCFDLLRSAASEPVLDIQKLIDAAIFNVIAGNADAHGKNFSLLYDNSGPRLAPLYDLIATMAYPELSAKFAMKIGKRAALEELDEKGWTKFADDAGVGLQLVKQRIEAVSVAVMDQATKIAADIAIHGLDQDALFRFAELVVSRAGEIRKTIKSGIKI